MKIPVIETIEKYSRPLQGEKDLDALMERVGDARVVLLGEASHGTQEYYMWRAEITKRLIQEKGFSFMAVEGDWPDCYEVNRFVKGYGGLNQDAEDILQVFKRWPSWMWANEEIRDLVDWIEKYNMEREIEDRFGFYGLDVYSLWESMDNIIEYLKKTDPDALPIAYRAYECFEPFGRNVYDYARTSAFVKEVCQKEVIDLLMKLSINTKKYKDDEEQKFNAEQNAFVMKNAAAYYRAMIQADNSSWNVRDEHMTRTLDRLLEYYGPESKAVVWAHNTHVGDARATPMFGNGMINIGQLARQRYGEGEVVLVGFASYSGNVTAGMSWGAPMQRMTVPEAMLGSWEQLFHEAEATDKLIITLEAKHSAGMERWRNHRAIGVIYNPSHEIGNYVPTDLVNRYDAFLFFDHTEALNPLPVGHFEIEETPETFPSGM